MVVPVIIMAEIAAPAFADNAFRSITGKGDDLHAVGSSSGGYKGGDGDLWTVGLPNDESETLPITSLLILPGSGC